MNHGNIPEHLIQTVLERADIVEVVGRYVSLSKQGKNFTGLCPFHSEKTPSFLVSPEKQIFKCFGCGKGGDVFRFLMNIDGISFPEAFNQLADEVGIRHQWKAKTIPLTPAQEEKRKLMEAYELTTKWYHNILLHTDVGRKAMEYLYDRGFSLKSIEAFQIGYAPPMWDKLHQFLSSKGFSSDFLEKGGLLRSTEKGYMDLFRDRIIFPIHETSGKVIAFAGRILGEGQPKYLNTPDTILFQKSRVLFHFHQAKLEARKTGYIVLFEGYADVIKAWQAGIRNGVASMGTSISEQHAQLLKRFTNQIVLCYDGDEAGQTAAHKNIQPLEKHRFSVRVSILPDRMDPDEYITVHGGESFRKNIIEAAVSTVEFHLLRLRNAYKLQESDGKLQYVRASLKVIARQHSPTVREHYLRALSSEFKFSLDTLKQECAEIRHELQKKRQVGDNNDIPWNNVKNNTSKGDTAPSLLPAWHIAERHLLAIMMHDPQITSYVEKKLGAGFQVESHAALAAYIYAYYTNHEEMMLQQFIGSLDEELANLASAISILYSKEATSQQVVDDYILEILKVPLQQQISRKKKEMLQAERSEDWMTAAQLGTEIITLERQLKAMQLESF